MTSNALAKFFDRAEKKDGAKIPLVYLEKSEYPAYAGTGILIINNEGMVEDIKPIHHFSKVSEIKPFMESLDKNYVVGKLTGYTISWVTLEGDRASTSKELIDCKVSEIKPFVGSFDPPFSGLIQEGDRGWTFEDIIEYLEEEFYMQVWKES